jgi:hypothetical protein
MYGLEAEAAIEFPIVLASQHDGSVVAGAGIARRGFDGGIRLEQAGGGTVAYTSGLGAAIGFALSYWIPIPLLPAVVGGVAGYLVGRRRRDREAVTLGKSLSQFLPRGAVAVVAVVEERMIGPLNGQLGLALRTTALPLDDPELLQLARALVRGNPDIADVLAEQARAQEARRREFPDTP